MAAVDAREALRLRLGRGARFDSPAAPSPELEWARRGTAYFARQLNDLSDSELRNPSFVPGWSKAHVVAHVGYHARQMAEAIERTRTGVGLPRSDSAAVHLARVRRGATLPPHALRHLFSHSEVHLNVEWRDLDEASWNGDVEDVAGDRVPIRGTPRMRSHVVWISAVDLGGSGAFQDFPGDLLEDIARQALLGHARELTRGLRIAVTDRSASLGESGRSSVQVEGALADIARWLTGRGAAGLRGGAIPGIPLQIPGFRKPAG